MSPPRKHSSRKPQVVLFLLILAAAGGTIYVSRTQPGCLKLAAWREWWAGRRGSAVGKPRLGQSPDMKGDKVITARAYFALVTEKALRLAAVDREVSARAPARALLQELVEGEVPKGCDRPLPPGVKLRNVRVEGEIATADFSQELTSKFRGGSDNEGVTVYAIVNTLTSLPGVNKAQILVEGQRVDTIGGHLDVSEPLASDDELVVVYR